jgi:hypothetical protein
MAKFQSRDDNGYKKLTGEVRRWVKSMQGQETEDERRQRQGLATPSSEFGAHQLTVVP